MQNAQNFNLPDLNYPYLKNVKNEPLTTLQKVKALEFEHHSNFTLLKRFLHELKTDNDNSLWLYNREVI